MENSENDCLKAKKRKNKTKKEKVKEKPETDNDEVVDNYEEEVFWCMAQIKLGLKTQKPTQEQAKKSKKLLNQLQSSKIPKPKKRMLMKQHFGDYRSKMASEVKMIGCEFMKLTIADDSAMEKSIFLKKKTSDWPVAATDSTFTFNFPAPT